MNKYFAGLLATYVGVRHILPPIDIEANYRDDRELLSKRTTNVLFFDIVNTWYDCDNFCGDINRYYWRRVNIITIPREPLYKK